MKKLLAFCALLCAYIVSAAVTINPTTSTFAKEGGAKAILTYGTGDWTATTDASWITFNTASGAAGDSCVYLVAANNTADTRVGTIDISGNTHTVTQTGYDATITPSVASFGIEGGEGRITVNTDVVASWTAVSSVDWIEVLAGAGTGPGVVTYLVAAHTESVGSRTGTMVIAGKTFTVKQSGLDVVLSPAEINLDYETHVFELHVTALASTTWEITPNVNWISVVDAGTKRGDYIAKLAVSTNPSAITRIGVVTVGTQNIKVYQTGTPDVSINILPREATADPTGAHANVAVIATPDLPWTAESLSSWLHVSTGQSGAGNGNIGYVAAPNPATTTRTGQIRISAVQPQPDYDLEYGHYVKDPAVAGWTYSNLFTPYEMGAVQRLFNFKLGEAETDASLYINEENQVVWQDSSTNIQPLGLFIEAGKSYPINAVYDGTTLTLYHGNTALHAVTTTVSETVGVGETTYPSPGVLIYGSFPTQNHWYRPLNIRELKEAHAYVSPAGGEYSSLAEGYCAKDESLIGSDEWTYTYLLRSIDSRRYEYSESLLSFRDHTRNRDVVITYYSYYYSPTFANNKYYYRVLVADSGVCTFSSENLTTPLNIVYKDSTLSFYHGTTLLYSLQGTITHSNPQEVFNTNSSATLQNCWNRALSVEELAEAHTFYHLPFGDSDEQRELDAKKASSPAYAALMQAITHTNTGIESDHLGLAFQAGIGYKTVPSLVDLNQVVPTINSNKKATAAEIQAQHEAFTNRSLTGYSFNFWVKATPETAFSLCRRTCYKTGTDEPHAYDTFTISQDCGLEGCQYNRIDDHYHEKYLDFYYQAGETVPHFKVTESGFVFGHDVTLTHTDDFEKGRWYMITLVGDGDRLVCYVNGKDIGVINDLGVTGRQKDGITPAFEFTKDIDDMEVFNAVLTPLQVAELYEMQKPLSVVHTVTQAPVEARAEKVTFDFPADGGAESTKLIIASNVTWESVSVEDWIIVTSPLSQTGSNSVAFSVLPNPSVYPRTGTIAAGGVILTINQAAYQAVVTTDTPSFGTESNSGYIDVLTEAGASWTATSNDPWITIVMGESGTGPGSLLFVVDPMTDTSSSRTGSITVAGETIYITQAGYELSIDPQVAQIGSNAGAGQFGVAAPIGAIWSAITTEPWIILTLNKDGVGNGTVYYSVLENTTGEVRIGKIIVAGKEYTITQLHQLQVVAETDGNGTVTGSGMYDTNAAATLIPTPNKGYVFSHWTGDMVGSDNPLNVTVDTSKNIKAHFVPEVAAVAFAETWAKDQDFVTESELTSRIDAAVLNATPGIEAAAIERETPAIEQAAVAAAKPAIEAAAIERETPTIKAAGVTEALANKDVFTKKSMKDMAFGAPVMEVDKNEVTVAISLQTADSLTLAEGESSPWNGLDLSKATLERDEQTKGLFRVRVPITSDAAFYKFVVVDEQEEAAR